MNREEAERVVCAIERLIARHEENKTSRPPPGNYWRDLSGDVTRRERQAIVDSLVED